jgi:hypothetical protein
VKWEHDNWTRQGTEGFLGHRVCQGPDVWPRGERSMQGLDPDGCLVRRYQAIETKTTEDMGASETAPWQRDAMQYPSEKSAREGIKGAFGLLTRAF